MGRMALIQSTKVNVPCKGLHLLAASGKQTKHRAAVLHLRLQVACSTRESQLYQITSLVGELFKNIIADPQRQDWTVKTPNRWRYKISKHCCLQELFGVSLLRFSCSTTVLVI